MTSIREVATAYYGEALVDIAESLMPSAASVHADGIASLLGRIADIDSHGEATTSSIPTPPQGLSPVEKAEFLKEHYPNKDELQ